METKHGLNCYECGKAYESKRSTSKYCGAKCRKLAFQNGKSENAKVSVPKIGATDFDRDGPQTGTGLYATGTAKPEQEQPAKVEQLTPALLDTLPVGVTRPTGQPNERTQAMTGENLNRRLIGVKVWQGGPEYAEVVHRFLTGKTEGMNLPTWAVA